MVTRAGIERAASAVIFVGVLALIVDMFLGWVTVSVISTGALEIDMQVTGSGWAGWGIVGGILGVMLVLWHVRSLRKGAASLGTAAVTAALAAAMAGFTIAQAVTGDVDVSANGTLFVRVTRQWPADLAIVLAAVVVAATTIRLVMAVLDAHRRPADRASSPAPLSMRQRPAGGDPTGL